jgi:hypothetical protein
MTPSLADLIKPKPPLATLEDGTPARLTPAALDILAKSELEKHIKDELRGLDRGARVEYRVIF